MVLSELSSLAKDTHFYIDAGAITILVQFLIAFFIAGIVMMKMYWDKVKSFFRSLHSKGNEDKSDDEPVK